jgi:hypothetical protein
VVAGQSFEATDEILGIWYAAGQTIDWLAVAGVTGGRVVGGQRFRYYLDEKVWGSNDEKRFYEQDVGPDTPENRDRVVAALESALTMTLMVGMTVWRFAGGTIAEAAHWMKAQEFAHVRMGGEAGVES